MHLRLVPVKLLTGKYCLTTLLKSFFFIDLQFTGQVVLLKFMRCESWLLVVYFWLAGVETVDYSRYPDREYQMKWLRMYLQLKAVHLGSDPSTVNNHDVEVLYVQVNKFALVGKQDIYIKLRRSRH